MQFARGNDNSRPHAAIGMHAEHLELLATVRPALPAGVASLAIQIRLDGAAISRFDVRHVRADGENLDAQLMPRDPRITEKRKLPQVTGDIRAADADAMHANQCLTRRRRGGLVDLRSERTRPVV